MVKKMDVILLEKVANLGDLGDTVSVRPGFGRNYLIPHGKAVPATADKIAEFEKRRAELEKRAAADLATATARAEALAQLEVVIAQKEGQEARFERLVDRPDFQELLIEGPLGDIWFSGILGGVPEEKLPEEHK